MEQSSSVAESVVPALLSVSGDAVMDMGSADVWTKRESQRQRRLWRLAVIVGIPAAFFWWRILDGRPFDLFRVPHIDWTLALPFIFIFAIVGGYGAMLINSRRSPHILFRPEQIDVRLKDVVGIDSVKEEVVRSINLFLAHKTFASQMGGTPRRGILFEGSPGTGKTHTAKAMAAEAGVPFLFVSATSFQSMFYGATAAKIRQYFKELRKTALAEGGAIGFIEEIDAIGGTRNGMHMTSLDGVSSMVNCCGSVTTLPSTFLHAGVGTAGAAGSMVTNKAISEGVGGVVNEELLVQMQSFDQPMGSQKFLAWGAKTVNKFLPAHRQVAGPTHRHANVLLIAATNRAESLDPALLRPGRFDRSLTFDLPDQKGRRALVDLFLARKSHHDELDADEHRDSIASVTVGFSPVMVEQVFDEALVNAVRRGDDKMTRTDVEHARLTLQVGIGQPVGYTDHETQLIATHEAGHATAAYLVAPTRRLEVLTIIKRRDALGMLAHGDSEEVYTRSRSEMTSLIQIAMGGQVAEELFFDDISTGPAGDLLYATNVASQMVGAAGMMGTLISYAAVSGSMFSDTNLVGRVLGDPDGRQRVEELLQDQKAFVKELLTENRHLVIALRDALMERHELVGREITDILDAARASGPTAASDTAPRVIDLTAAERATVSH